MDFDVFGTKVLYCEWNQELVIKGNRDYDHPTIIFYKAEFVSGIKILKGMEILCVKSIGDALFQIIFRNVTYTTLLRAERYEKVMNN